MIRNKKILAGLNSDSYEHPFDRKALEALEKTPGLDLIGKFITKNLVERVYNVQYTGSHLRVTKESYPKIYEYLEYACQILDVKNKPELYIQWGYNISACTVGSENPIIVLNSGLIDLCDDDEIMFVIGHELGHIKSNHTLYHMMAQVINIAVSMIPFGDIASAPLQYALYYWDRMSEFTADRAGLLCCQSKDATVRSFMKLAGMPIKQFNDMHYQTFIQQARDFKQLDYDGMNKVIKLISIADESHPWTVMRAAELLNWINEGACAEIINRGNMPMLIKAKPIPQMTITKKEDDDISSSRKMKISSKQQ